jgi:23S rRNA (pseudouridine1915-N3)-methyltransferase
MRFFVLAVGNRMPAWIESGFQEYARRMPRHARVELREIRPERRPPGVVTERVLAAERDRILAALPGNCEAVALDERGSAMTTVQLAEQIGRWQAAGRDVAWIIGGADGLHPDLKRKAARLVSLSAMTLPHGLARVLLAEQLYRAVSLLGGHPYHRE